MKKWICLGIVCVLLGLLACAGMAEAHTEVEDAEMASFRALAEAYVPMAVEDCPDHTVFQVIGFMEAQQLKTPTACAAITPSAPFGAEPRTN